MQKATRTTISSEEWAAIRDFETDDPSVPTDKYEAKYLEDVEKPYVEDDLILLKKTSSLGGERIYHLPRDVVEELAGRLD